jgi:sterol 3beta-glucosyltransferase
MHVTLITYGSRGDVEPFVALGRGFLRVGDEVRVVAPEVFESLVTVHGIDFVGLPGEPDRLVQNLVDMAGRNPLRMVSAMSRFVLPLAAGVFERVQQACTGTEVIIHSFLLTQAGHEVARALGIPDVSAQFFPIFSTTAEFAAVVFPDLPLGRPYRRLSHEMTTQIFRQGGRVLYWWVRRANPHLPRLQAWPFSRENKRRPPVLYAFSPHVVPRPRDWPADAHITGYWFLDDTGDWQPPQGLLDFLDAGPRPIAIGLGSTVTQRPDEIAHTVLRALALSGQRGVLVGRAWPQIAMSADVYALDFAPYGWLFPRMSAVVHHGGAGTTGVGLQAGVPNVVVPFTSDQPFWGRRVYELGAGPRPIPTQKLSAEKLAEALGKSVTDDSMRSLARELGERLGAEDGVSRAVGLVRRHVETMARRARRPIEAV